MFNKKLKEEIQELKDLLEDSGIQYVEDYFKDCPCCKHEGKLLLEDAESFEVYAYAEAYLFKTLQTRYTSKESYETHKVAIRKMDKAAKKRCGTY